MTEPPHPIRDDLKAYCDGELPPLRRAVVRRHLAACAACREEVHVMQTLHEGLQAGAAPATAFAPALRARILAQVAGVPPLPSPRRAPRILQYSLAASFAVNCAFLFLLRSGTAPPARPTPAAYSPASTSDPSEPTAPRLGQRPAVPQGRPVRSRAKATPPAAISSKTPAAQDARPDVSPVPPGLVRPPAPPELGAGGPPPAVPSVQPGHAPPPASVPAPSKPVTAQSGGGVLAAKMRANNATASKPEAASDAPAPPPGLTQESASPPPPAAPQPPTPAPAPRAMARSLGGAGFAGGGGGTHDLAADRERPAATQPWPAIPQPSASPNAVPGAKPVTADWQVDDQGRVSDIRFAPTGDNTVDAAIRDAIRGNRYLPARKNGRPTAARMTLTFVVNL